MLAMLPCYHMSDKMDSPEFQNAITQHLEGLGCSVEQNASFLVDPKSTSLSKFLTKIQDNSNFGPKLVYFLNNSDSLYLKKQIFPKNLFLPRIRAQNETP